MAIYLGMTQDLESAKKYLLENYKGMYPDIEMGPYKNKEYATKYIHFMKNRFVGTIEIDLPNFSSARNNQYKWWVFAVEHSGSVH